MRNVITFDENGNEKLKNKILLSLVIVVGISFLLLSYYTDTLGKFTNFISGNSATGSSSLLTDTKDSYGGLCSPNVNYGGENILVVRRDDSGCRYGSSSGDTEGFILFDGNIPKRVSSATLFIHTISGEQKGSFQICPIVKSWDENSVTWNFESTSVYWESAGLSSKDFDSKGCAYFDIDGSGYTSVDVTQLVQYWSNHANLGAVIKSDSGSVTFFSKESDNPAFIIVKN